MQLKMQAIARQKLEVVQQAFSPPALRDWRGQFASEFLSELSVLLLSFKP